MVYFHCHYNEITPVDIRAWQNEQIALGYADAYLDRIQNMITTIFNYAVDYYNLPVNPCNKAGHMGKRTRSMKFWTVDEYNSVLAFVTDITAKTALQVLFYSGMRFVSYWPSHWPTWTLINLPSTLQSHTSIKPAAGSLLHPKQITAFA